MTANYSMSEPLRRRLGLPPMANPAIVQIKNHMFGNSRKYIRLVLEASAGNEIDVDDLMEAARLAGKFPAIINRDLKGCHGRLPGLVAISPPLSQSARRRRRQPIRRLKP